MIARQRGVIAVRQSRIAGGVTRFTDAHERRRRRERNRREQYDVDDSEQNDRGRHRYAEHHDRRNRAPRTGNDRGERNFDIVAECRGVFGGHGPREVGQDCQPKTDERK